MSGLTNQHGRNSCVSLSNLSSSYCFSSTHLRKDLRRCHPLLRDTAAVDRFFSLPSFLLRTTGETCQVHLPCNGQRKTKGINPWKFKREKKLQPLRRRERLRPHHTVPPTPVAHDTRLPRSWLNQVISYPGNSIPVKRLKFRLLVSFLESYFDCSRGETACSFWCLRCHPVHHPDSKHIPSSSPLLVVHEQRRPSDLSCSVKGTTRRRPSSICSLSHLPPPARACSRLHSTSLLFLSLPLPPLRPHSPRHTTYQYSSLSTCLLPTQSLHQAAALPRRAAATLLSCSTQLQRGTDRCCEREGFLQMRSRTM